MQRYNQGVLNLLSYIFVVGLLPLFVGTTVWGSVMMLMLWRRSIQCFNGELVIFSFSVLWLVFSYVAIVSYCSLLVYGLNTSSKAKEVRKQLLQLLRKLNNSELSSDHEIVENAIANV